MKAKIDQNIEKKRLDALRRYDILDSETEQIYDDLVKLASHICGTPMSLVSLIDVDRQWSKAHHGIEGGEVPRDIAFCSHAILQDDVLIVNDASRDRRFSRNPLVVQEPGLRFYAGAPLKAPCGSRLGTLCVIDTQPRDLTGDQLAALSILSKQVIDQFELRITNITLEEDSQLIRQLNEQKDQLIYSLSHDLKGAFSNINGLSSLLIEQIEQANVTGLEQMAHYIHDAGGSALQLLENVLQWSMNQDGATSYVPDKINLKDVIEEVLGTVKSIYRSKSHLFEVVCRDELLVLGDRHMLYSVLYNLLSNACKYTPENGLITVAACVSRGDAEISIIDSGVGMQPERVESILNGTRSSSLVGTNGERGTGFGLVLCQQFIERNKGRLEVRSEWGKGSIFRFTIPRARETQHLESS